jgi:hypothetical protein
MGLIEKFKNLGRAQEGASEKAPLASEYVDWLPLYMLRSSITELRIDTARALPMDEDAPVPPDANVVINRIKVLCGLNPFPLAENTEGRFERKHAGHRLLFSVRFEDRSERSICHLKLSIRA